MADTLGQLLRQAREARSETLADVERETRIRARHLAAIEADDYAALPSPVQARGFIKNYAVHLGLDVQDVLARYEAAQKQRPGKPAARAAPARLDLTQPPRTDSAPRDAASRALIPPKLPPAASQQIATSPGMPLVPTRRPRLLSADVLVAVVITLVLVALLVWGGSRLANSLAAATVTPTASFVVGLTTVQPTASDTPLPVASATLVLPSPAAGYSGVNVTVRAELRSWVQVKVDGTEKFAGLMPPGEAREFIGQGVVEVVTGNGKGTRVTFNGVDQGDMGQELGEVVDRLWTLQGMVIPTPTITPTPSITPSPTKTPLVTSTPGPSETPGS